MGGMTPGTRKKAVSPAKRGASPAGLCQSEEVQHVLRQLDGAECRSKFNGVSFMLEAKVFAFQAQDGLVLKLPAARVQELVREREARALVMGKRVMRSGYGSKCRDTRSKTDLGTIEIASEHSGCSR